MTISPSNIDVFDATMMVEGNHEITNLPIDGDNYQDYFIASCQRLIDTGMAWSLQGSFGRTCQAMIDEGLCHG